MIFPSADDDQYWQCWNMWVYEVKAYLPGKRWSEEGFCATFCWILGIFDELKLTLAAKTVVNRIYSRSTLAVKTGMRLTWGRSRRNQTERKVKNNGSTNRISGIVQLVCTASKDLLKQFSNTWSIWALFKVSVQSNQLGHRRDERYISGQPDWYSNGSLSYKSD